MMTMTLLMHRGGGPSAWTHPSCPLFAWGALRLSWPSIWVSLTPLGAKAPWLSLDSWIGNDGYCGLVTPGSLL